MWKFVCSLFFSMAFALTALGTPSYFYNSLTESPFLADKPVVNGTTFDDIRQTNSPTCSFLAALSSAAHSGIDLSKNIKHLGGRNYSVRLFVNNRWSDVKVTFDGWTAHDPSPKEAGEFWTALYQRAYLTAFNVDCSDADTRKWAVVKDGQKTDQEKDDQDWMTCRTALTAITGQQAQFWRVDGDDPAATIKLIRDALEMKQCVVMATKGRSDKDLVEDKVCLVQNHAYTVTAAGPYWIELRNPWGRDIPVSMLKHTHWKNGRPIYAFKEDYSDGKDNDPNDGIVRVPRTQLKYFVQAYVTREAPRLMPKIIDEESDR